MSTVDVYLAYLGQQQSIFVQLVLSRHIRYDSRLAGCGSAHQPQFFRFKIHRPPYNAFLCYRRSIHWAAFYYRNNGDVSVQQRPLVLDSRINKVGRWSTRLRNIERRKTISRHSTGERRQTSIGQKDNTSIETVRLLSTPQSLQYCDVLYDRDSSRDRKCGQITAVSVLMTKCHDDCSAHYVRGIILLFELTSELT